MESAHEPVNENEISAMLESNSSRTGVNELLPVPDAGVRRRDKRGVICGWIRDNLLLVLSLCGAVAGFTLGFLLRLAKPSEDAIIWTGLPGEIYMRMLKATILPLIVSSVISGSASLNPKSSGRIGGVALAYIVITNATGVLCALILGVIIQPGSGQVVVVKGAEPNTQNLETQDIFVDLIRNLFPDNLITACFQQSQTKYVIMERNDVINTSHGTINETMREYRRTLGTTSATNLLGLIIASAVLGIAAAKCGEVGRPFLNFFQSTSDVITTLFHWMMWYTPVGTASLIAASIIKASDIENTFTHLGMFILTVTAGHVIYHVVVIPCAYLLFMRRNPFSFYLSCIRPMLVAFAPPSSAMAIPSMIECLEDDNDVSKQVARFVAPLAATINRDGSALFIAAAAVYCGQAERSLTFQRILMIGVLSTAGSLAVPPVPSSSIVTLLIMLSSLSISPANIGLIMALEWFSDRSRTTTNILSSCFCGVITNKYSKKWLPSRDLPSTKLSHLQIMLDCPDTNTRV